MRASLSDETLSSGAFLARLAERVPEIARLVAENRKLNFGQVIPHQVMGDIPAWIIRELLEPGAGQAPSAVGDALDALEEAVSPPGPSAAVDDLVRGSFLAHLWKAPRVTRLLGSSLREMLKDF